MEPIETIREALNTGKSLPELSPRESFVLVLALAERAGFGMDEHDDPQERATEAHCLLLGIARTI